MTYKWREGSRPPVRMLLGKETEIPADEFAVVLRELPTNSPDAPGILLEASRSSNHVLHYEIWSEGDDVWAERARRDRCREIISSHKRVEVIGGKTIEVRTVEFVRTPEGKRWAQIDAILADEALEKAYVREIISLQEQAKNKLESFYALKFGE